MCCCRWLAVLQEALCYDVDSFDNTVPAGKKLWRQHSRYTFIIKRFHILPIFWCLFFVPGDCRGAELHDKLFKKNIFIPQFTASGLCWGAEKRPTVAVRCQHSFVMSTRADFQCSVCWCTVEEADWRRWQTRSMFTHQKTLRGPKKQLLDWTRAGCVAWNEVIFLQRTNTGAVGPSSTPLRHNYW